MQDVRRVVEQPPQPVAAEVPHHGTALPLGITLDGVTDVAGRRAGLDGRNAAHHGLMGHVYQSLRLSRNGAHRIHPRGIAMPAVQDHRHVDVDDVAFLQLLRPRNAVADHMVDRRADGFRKAPVVERRGLGSVIDDEFVYQPVELVRGHAGLHVGRDHVQRLGGKTARATHALESLRAPELDLSGIGVRCRLRGDVAWSVHGISTGMTLRATISCGVTSQARAYTSTPASTARFHSSI